MRLIKMFGLAAVAAVAAMAFVGAASAPAANTQLCTAHDALTCDAGEAAGSVDMNNTGLDVGILLNSLANILCLTISLSGIPLALANPQSVHITEFLLTECGTKTAHENCEIRFTTLPLTNLNKTGLDLGTLTATNGQLLVTCVNVVGALGIECTYNTTGLTFAIGGQEATADDTSMSEIGSDFLCPNNPTLDLLLEATEDRYVLA